MKIRILIFIVFFLPCGSCGMYWRKGGKRKPSSKQQSSNARMRPQEKTATEKLQDFFNDPLEKNPLWKHYGFEPIWRNYFSIIEKLIDEGASVNIKDQFGVPLLHRVIWKLKNETPREIKEKIIRKLLENNADVNAIDSSGQTPLYQSVLANLPYVTQLLLEYGADVNLKTKEGDTALDVAKHFNRTEVIEVIENYMRTHKIP